MQGRGDWGRGWGTGRGGEGAREQGVATRGGDVDDDSLPPKGVERVAGMWERRADKHLRYPHPQSGMGHWKGLQAFYSSQSSLHSSQSR